MLNAGGFFTFLMQDLWLNGRVSLVFVRTTHGLAEFNAPPTGYRFPLLFYFQDHPL